MPRSKQPKQSYRRVKKMGSGPAFRAGKRAVEVGWAMPPVKLGRVAQIQEAIDSINLLAPYTESEILNRILAQLQEARKRQLESRETEEFKRLLDGTRAGPKVSTGPYAIKHGLASDTFELGTIRQIREALNLLALIQSNPIISRVISALAQAIERQEAIPEEDHAAILKAGNV